MNACTAPLLLWLALLASPAMATETNSASTSAATNLPGSNRADGRSGAEAIAIADLTALVGDFVENSDKLDRHQRFWAEDLVYTSSGADVKDKASILRSFEDRPPSATDKPAEPSVRFTAEDILVRPYGDAAAVTFRLVATMPDGKRAHYRNSGMFLRREGRWQAVTWHATKVPEPVADATPSGGK